MNDRTMFTSGPSGNTGGYSAHDLARANRILAAWDHEHPYADDDARAVIARRILRLVEGHEEERRIIEIVAAPGEVKP